MSFLVCCANGAGSSLIMKMTMQKALDKVGLKPGKVHHCALSEGKTAAAQYDVPRVPADFSAASPAPAAFFPLRKPSLFSCRHLRVPSGSPCSRSHKHTVTGYSAL